MQTRYRKMDVEEKMNQNRNERNLLRELSTNDKKHREAVAEWIHSAIELADTVEDVHDIDNIKQQLAQLQRNLENTPSVDTEIDGKLEELFIQFRNEYTSSTPQIIKLELQSSQLAEEIGQVGEKIEFYQSEENALKEWCKVQDNRHNNELKKREQQIYLASIFSQILTDMGGEMAEYVIERVNSALTSAQV